MRATSPVSPSRSARSRGRDATPGRPSTRLVHVDAVRGVAASVVLGHHLFHNTVLEVSLAQILPGAVRWVLTYGATGVEAFFVVSGFVIVLSLAGMRLDRRDAVRFAMRRQLRLDPPYWTMIVAALCLTTVEHAVGFVEGSIPLPAAIATNALYAPRLAGQPLILDVAWTLCIEIQFYLAVLALLGIGRGCARLRGGRWPNAAAVDQRWVVAMFAVTGLASLGFGAIRHSWGMGPTRDALFVEDWFFFVLGALGALAYLRRCSWAVPIAFAGAVVTAMVAPQSTLPVDRVVVAVVTLVVLVVGVRSPAAARVLGGGRVLQYLGSRSYSIYLAHLPVLSVVMRAGYKLTGSSPGFALCWFVVAAAASFASAELLHRFVESPAVRLSALVKRSGPRAAWQTVTRRIQSAARPAAS